MGPKSNDWCPYKNKKGHAETENRSHVKMETKTEAK